MTPSFIFRGKQNLEDHLRDEEAYDDWFYGFPDLDFLPTVWTCFLAYAGQFGLLILAFFSGWIMALTDNWLARQTTVTAFLTGVWLTVIPVQLEQGVSGIIYVLRGLAIMLACVLVLTRASACEEAEITLRPIRC